MVKNPSVDAGDLRDTGSIPGQEDPLEKEMATHSSILAWRIRGSLVTNFRNQFFDVSKVKFITKILEAHRMDRRLGISSESR